MRRPQGLWITDWFVELGKKKIKQFFESNFLHLTIASYSPIHFVLLHSLVDSLSIATFTFDGNL